MILAGPLTQIFRAIATGPGGDTRMTHLHSIGMGLSILEQGSGHRSQHRHLPLKHACERAISAWATGRERNR